MYLSELFLKMLKEDYSIFSVKNAIEACNEEFLRRQESIQFSELMDFLDVYKGLDDIIGEADRRRFLLLEECLAVV